MRASVTPVILFASLASALPQWSDHYKREVPTPSPDLVQRQDSYVPPSYSPETPVANAAVRRQESFTFTGPGGKRNVPPTPVPQALVDAIIRRQDTVLVPPKRDLLPTPAPEAVVKERIDPRQKTDWYVLTPRGMPLETPAPYGAPAGAIVERQKTEEDPPITNARRDDAKAPEPTEPPSARDLPAGAVVERRNTEEEPITEPPGGKARAIVERQKTEEDPPITNARRAEGPEPTEPPSPCDQAAPAKIKPRTEEEQPTQPPKARANADTNPIFKALSGTYSLVNTSSSRNGEPIPDLPYGKAPVGLLIYTESGFMSATITATEPEFRPNLTFPYQPNDSDADWALVGKHSIGYAGPYSVNEELPATETEGQIFHGPLTVANVPTWAGQKAKRNYTIVEVEENGEEVKYLKIGSERGNGYRGILWWKKVV
ncbi:hypothetical protein J4E91_002520 [Alternaria rosae]|nr:hypothetical protein J4E91_002520 [Alternaria rosae]